jgi:hypothetical protein
MNNGTGASPKGDLPFLATFDLTTKKLDSHLEMLRRLF